MRVLEFRPKTGGTNFGDALGPWLADVLLPPIGLHIRPDLVFLGPGTLLNDRLAPGPKLVFGSGAGYGPPPDVTPDWDIRFVRGPHTAEALGLSHDVAITDPGAMVGFLRNKLEPEFEAGYMPRFDKAGPAMKEWAQGIGMLYIDPQGDVDAVIDQIRKCRRVASEALHGAVVADALRIPWVSVETSGVHEFKWHDWLPTLGLAYHPIDRYDLNGPFDRVPWVKSMDVVLRTRLLQLAREVRRLQEDIEQRRGTFAVEREPEITEPSAIPAEKLH